jgi:uracil DNA glycosylase
MNWENFKGAFHESWHEKIRPFIESEECDKIYAFLKSESKRGKKIAPLSMNTFRCFKETSLDDLKVVLMGLCPYHTFIQGNPVADGLLMGCTVTGKLQPTLEQFYGGIEREMFNGLCLDMIKDPDVSYLAHQGVLMLNAALTTEMNKAGSHLALWEPFIKYLYENIINETQVPTIYLGKDASRYKKYCAPFTWQFELSHPAAASYKGTDWDTEGVFGKANAIIWENTKDCIQWLRIEKPF